MYDPNTTTHLIVPVACPVPHRPIDAPKLSEKLKINVVPDSLAFHVYQQPTVEEEFFCNYELNLAFHSAIENNGMLISGIGENGEARIIELTNHRFFLATGFLPQFLSQAERPHPLITAYLEAALNFQKAAPSGV